MDNLEYTITRYKENYQEGILPDDFEGRVFGKIKKKKRQRKIATSAAVMVVFAAFLFIVQGVIFKSDPTNTNANSQSFDREFVKEQPQVTSSQPETIYTAKETGNNSTQAVGSNLEKEEVPVEGEVIYSSFDRDSNYSIHQVSYNEGINSF